jgi:hypothetical protein
MRRHCNALRASTDYTKKRAGQEAGAGLVLLFVLLPAAPAPVYVIGGYSFLL